MLVLQIDRNDERYQQERELRNRVLLQPIGIPDFGWEMKDETSLHFTAIDKDRVVGCVVLWPDPKDEGAAQLLQMAVEPGYQGQGVGRLMVEKLLQTASQNGIRRVWCHARVNVATFYKKLGFVVVGEVFQEADIDHQIMERFTLG